MVWREERGQGRDSFRPPNCLRSLFYMTYIVLCYEYPPMDEDIVGL